MYPHIYTRFSLSLSLSFSSRRTPPFSPLSRRNNSPPAMECVSFRAVFLLRIPNDIYSYYAVITPSRDTSLSLQFTLPPPVWRRRSNARVKNRGTQHNNLQIAKTYRLCVHCSRKKILLSDTKCKCLHVTIDTVRFAIIYFMLKEFQLSMFVVPLIKIFWILLPDV